ncbi:MAG: pyridoxamine 5'-phosphate oxidase [Bacteroidetes bacterium]|nr:pyridoxamine 5'-phosphate oxidase [Bacteroidota bacterium]
MEKDRIASLRSEYQLHTLDEAHLPETPFLAFQNWFKEAMDCGCREVNAMVLSTVNQEHKPSSRVVLLKELDQNGFVFFTNYQSKKGMDLKINPHAALNFFWPELERQVRIEGTVEKISDGESEAYFVSRPRLSQAGAIASNQSQEIPDRTELENRMKKLTELPESEILQKPESWGGYRLKPVYLEFWQGRPGRLHDRIAYELSNEIWRKFRLSP